MKYAALCLVLFLVGACTTQGPVVYTYPVDDAESVANDWNNGEKLMLTGTVWPSRAHSKYDITTDDGRSAHLRGNRIDHLKPGTKIMLSGRVECVNSYGTAGASDVAHNQTYYFINVDKFKVVQEAAWDIDFQNAVDHDKPDYSLR